MAHQNHKRYPSMFCKPKPIVTKTCLYQRKWFIHKQKLQTHSMNINKDEEQSEKPSMGGLGLLFEAVDPLSSNKRLSITETRSTTSVPDMNDDKLMLFDSNKRHKKAKSELIKRYSAINPAAMLHSHYYKHSQLQFDDNISCIHGHYHQHKAKLLKPFKLSALIPQLLQYRVIHCGYITKRHKIHEKWKKRFALLLCAKMDDYYQFQLLYFDNDKLSKFKGVISFTNQCKIGLITPKSSQISYKSIPLYHQQEIEHSLNVSKSVSMSFGNTYLNDPICSDLENICPSHYGFSIVDTKRDKTWFIDTNNQQNAQKWLLSIWNIDKCFVSNKQLCVEEGFSDFVEIEIDGYNTKCNTFISRLKYMMIVPSWCCIGFKGILLFDCCCIDNENGTCFEPYFCKAPHRVRMKESSLFIDNDKENEDNSYFELVCDFNKCLCNARNREAKLLWNTALHHYTKSGF